GGAGGGPHQRFEGWAEGGSLGAGVEGRVPGMIHCSLPFTFAWPRPAGSLNHSLGRRRMLSSVYCMKSRQTGAATWLASAPIGIAVQAGLPNQKAVSSGGVHPTAQADWQQSVVPV